MADKELRGWVSDQLHTLVGFSDKTVADFILASAKKAKDANSLLASLTDFGVPNSSSGAAFAQQLLQRLPSRGGGANASAAKQQAAAAKQLVKKSRAYDILDADELEEYEQQQLQKQQQQHPAAAA